MAFTYTAERVTAVSVGDYVAAWIGAGKNSFVFKEPTASGASYPNQISKIVKQPSVNPGAATDADALYTVYLTDPNYNNLPVQFTVNGHSDWILTVTGTA